MNHRNGKRVVKKEVVTWIQSNVSIFLDLMKVSKTDFAHLLGISRNSLYNVLNNKNALDGKWILAIFFVMDYIMNEKRNDSYAYRIALDLMSPMAHYATHIEEIYED